MRFVLAVGGEMPVVSTYWKALPGSSVAVALAKSSKPQGSRKTPSRGRVAEWLKAPDSKLFSPLWTDFLPLGQKCQFRPISKDSNRCLLDRLGHQVTRFSARSIQVEYTSLVRSPHDHHPLSEGCLSSSYTCNHSLPSLLPLARYEIFSAFFRFLPYSGQEWDDTIQLMPAEQLLGLASRFHPPSR